MRVHLARRFPAAIALVSLAVLSACTNVAGLDCDEIAEQAKRISENQPVQISSIANAQETSRTENEARCSGEAQLSTGETATVYLRAYEEGGNVMVAYQGMPFE